VVVLLHGGEFGGCAEISWADTIAPLAQRYRVIAPDWLGFGHTDKMHDFLGGQRRRLWHMGRFLEAMAIDSAAFVGNSMGGSLLAGVAASPAIEWPIAAIVLASGGGFAPDNAARRTLLDFDGTEESMRRMLSALFHSPQWAQDEAYVQRRLALATAPGAWEAVAASRFKSPLVPPRSEFGSPDQVEYERIDVPTLVIAGADDQLRLPGYADELAGRIRDSSLLVFDECGHCPQIEKAADFNIAVSAFLDEVYPSDGSTRGVVAAGASGGCGIP
jgi:pimeloyl-ACP methyl ester carboxylesterase